MEIYSSLEQLTDLVETNQQVIKHLRTFLDSHYEKLKKAEKMLEEFVLMGREAEAKPKVFMGIPLNSLLMIQHLTFDLDSFTELFRSQDIRSEIVNKLNETNHTIPYEVDYYGSIQALIRLEDTYLLTPSDVRKGEYKNWKAFRALNAFECFQIGKYAHSRQDHYHAVRWLTEALDLAEQEGSQSMLNRTLAIEYLANSTLQRGNIRHAIDLIRSLLSTDPTNQKLQEDLKLYKRASADKIASKLDEILNKSHINLDELFPNDFSRPPHNLEVYESLCRGDYPKPKTSHLKCRYASYHPLLKIAPVKEELVNENPPIWVFYDVLTEKQMSRMIELALTRLKRATVFPNRIVDTRISKTAWINSPEDPIFPVLTNLVSAITNLSLISAEPWQMNNYGLGGIYHPHYDAYHFNDTEYHNNRIATWMFYIQAPETGGATAFPNLGIKIEPVSRSAVFWYNTLLNGGGDKRSLHAACPVFVGSKWVCNKWIHDIGQGLRRPCSLNREE